MQKAGAVTYALIILDMHMPQMDGLEAARRIRQGAGAAHLPILAMTGNAFQSDIDQCLAAGMDELLAKPTAPDALYATLLKWLSQPAAAVA
ncbi:MAG: response regulator [Rhodoferax sp.]|nr:response regulator [Rhodoferax sp.]